MTDEGNGRRDAQVHLRLTAADAERMRDRAAAAGMSLSAYIRSAALGDGAPTPSPAADARELRPLYGELRRCGSNVNQIARALNTYGAEGAGDAAVASALAALERACDAVTVAIRAARP